ncbi:MAG: hypothetical protein ACJ8IK_27420 [Burkholderiaceae bacterium]
MNGPVPPFLLALELGPDADERSIRRAYARRLKLIDAAADPAGFQALRETLETALRWAAWQARTASDEAPSSTPDAACAPSVDAPQAPAPSPLLDASLRPAPAIEPEPDPVSTAGEPAFAAFHARFERGVESPEQAGALLEAALQDERLVNLEARTFFEWRVAGLLAGGWRPGHEMLFWPAAVAFGWDTDRRRLALFGSLGAFMDAAIRERFAFFAQDTPQFDQQRLLIQRLRVAGPPDRAELLQAPLLGLLLQRYPNWMRTMTRQEIVQEWIAAWNALPADARVNEGPAAAPVAPPPPAREPPKPGGGFRMGWGLLVVAIALVRGLSALGDGETRGAPPPRPAYQPPPVSVPPPPPVLTLDAGAPKGQFDIPLTGNSDPPHWTPPGPGVHARVDADERTRRALEALRHADAGPALPAIPAPRPRAQAAAKPAPEPAFESLAPGNSKYQLHAEPQETRVDPTAVEPPPRRWGSGYTPPADFRLTTPADGKRVPGLADLARPPKLPPAKPQDDPAQ